MSSRPMMKRRASPSCPRTTPRMKILRSTKPRRRRPRRSLRLRRLSPHAGAVAAPPPRRLRRLLRPRAGGPGGIPLCRPRKCGRRPSTCGPRRARRGWSATTSAGRASRRRELSSLTRRVRSRATGASCSSRRSRTPSTTTSSSARTSYVKAVHADEGPTIKRFRPRAMGRATRIRKRTSHLTILLTPKE